MQHTVRPINKSFCLQMLCEENYVKLLRLVPNINQGDFSSVAIQTNVLATGPFTFTAYIHPIASNTRSAESGFKCRIYLDTKSVEVLNIDAYSIPHQQQTTSPKAILNNKWALNYFFEKWLSFQLNLSRIAQPNQQSINA
ncbi:MAG: DUF1249 domain-containing protein [Cycloclasticus sp.]|nr:MAG: hypothetical protein AXW16_00350 [Cycloclasticus sp. Phe_18]MBV1913150.1 DUF1249 domain-containing protein [Cycloclasticus sp.]